MKNTKTFKLGVGAIAWTNPGIEQFDDSYTGEQILSEMSQLGYEGTEMNRKFPSDPETLRAVLHGHRLKIASQYKAVVFSDRAYASEELEALKKHADFLKVMGSRHVIVCEVGGAAFMDPRNPNSRKIASLTEDGWDSLVEHLHLAGEYCNGLGMRLVYHFHVGTVIEQKKEIDFLMERTDSKLLGLLADTGHACYGGYDPAELFARYIGRIDYIHLKDVRKNVLNAAIRDGLDFKQAIRNGIFTIPGDGDIDFKPIFLLLNDSAYDSWIIMETEQDPAKANPYESAGKAKKYIENLAASL